MEQGNAVRMGTKRGVEVEIDRSDSRSLRYLFIITYGRSGSTLLQGILNSIPGYLIRGENRSMMEDLYAFHQKGIRERDSHKGRGPLLETNAWFGIDGYPDADAFNDIQNLILNTIIRPFANSKVVGFKEIRWARQDLLEYVQFIRNVFPGARFIINTRDHASVSRSKWWANNPNALEQLDALEGRFLALADVLPESSVFRVHYDDYVRNPQVLRAMFQWLGESFELERLNHTMEKPHSY